VQVELGLTVRVVGGERNHLARKTGDRDGVLVREGAEVWLFRLGSGFAERDDDRAFRGSAVLFTREVVPGGESFGHVRPGGRAEADVPARAVFHVVPAQDRQRGDVEVQAGDPRKGERRPAVGGGYARCGDLVVGVEDQRRAIPVGAETVGNRCPGSAAAGNQVPGGNEREQLRVVDQLAGLGRLLGPEPDGGG